MVHLKKFARRIGNVVEETKLKYQRQILRWTVIYSPGEMKRFSALTIVSLTALIILVLCVVEETKNAVLHGQSSLLFVDHQNDLSSTECNLDYITMKTREDDDPCVIDFIRRFYLFNNNLPIPVLTGVSSNDVMLANKSPFLDHHQLIDSNNELSTTYDERKVSQVVTKLMQSRGKKQAQGFFVECCGPSLLPAERDQSSNIRRPFSSTLHLETFWDWSGILINSNPDNIDLMRNNRKNVNNNKLAALPICLNLGNDTNTINSAVAIPSGNYFINEKKRSTLHDATLQVVIPSGNYFIDKKKRLTDSSFNQETVNIPSTSSPESLDRELIYNVIDDWEQCFSLNSILLASNQSKIDFLSLIDLEGVNELQFLQNIPWYQIDVKMVALKVSGYPDVVKRAVFEFMEYVGFFKYTRRNLKVIGEVVFLVKKRPFEKITLPEKYREF